MAAAPSHTGMCHFKPQASNSDPATVEDEKVVKFIGKKNLGKILKG